jgi:L-threonylcarbamoyladenylate synthase
LSIQKAIDLLKNGGVVALPTETVYGLAADCLNDSAVRHIFELKGRPSHNPLIIHVRDFDQAQEYGVFSHAAKVLAAAFWPGPLTIVVPMNKPVASCVSAGLSTIAIRCPNHEAALDLLRRYPNPLAAPSANKSGYVSPTSSDHVRAEFGDTVFILEAESSVVGLESTIVDCSSSCVEILRPGFITEQDLEMALGYSVGFSKSSAEIKCPGQLLQHYSPKTNLLINVQENHFGALCLNFGSSNLLGSFEINLSKTGSLEEAARNLFSYLRLLDKKASELSSSCIVVAPIPNSGVGIAINERLEKAAAKKGL